jgi:hypothetical protein
MCEACCEPIISIVARKVDMSETQLDTICSNAAALSSLLWQAHHQWSGTALAASGRCLRLQSSLSCAHLILVAQLILIFQAGCFVALHTSRSADFKSRTSPNPCWKCDHLSYVLCLHFLPFTCLARVSIEHCWCRRKRFFRIEGRQKVMLELWLKKFPIDLNY